jgi:hypothetical protein
MKGVVVGHYETSLRQALYTATILNASLTRFWTSPSSSSTSLTPLDTLPLYACLFRLKYALREIYILTWLEGLTLLDQHNYPRLYSPSYPMMEVTSELVSRADNFTRLVVRAP